jgi:hypothetical protein
MRWALLLACILIGGCTSLVYRDAGDALAAFEPLPGDGRIRFAPGGEQHAQQVAPLLDDAARQVESVHGRAFRAPPVVHVCGDDACFHRFVDARWNFTAAVLYDNRLLLAPRLFARERERLRPVLIHELSHLHMGQYRGHYTMAIPVWFHEGLASLAAGGGGANLVTDDDAWRAALARRHFEADEQHLPWLRRRAQSWGLPISIFYRQSMLFLADLRARDPDRFLALLHRLQDGADFDEAFAQTYQANPNRLAQAFFGCIDVRPSEGNPRCHPPPPGH